MTMTVPNKISDFPAPEAFQFICINEDADPETIKIVDSLVKDYNLTRIVPMAATFITQKCPVIMFCDVDVGDINNPNYYSYNHYSNVGEFRRVVFVKNILEGKCVNVMHLFMNNSTVHATIAFKSNEIETVTSNIKYYEKLSTGTYKIIKTVWFAEDDKHHTVCIPIYDHEKNVTINKDGLISNGNLNMKLLDNDFIIEYPENTEKFMLSTYIRGINEQIIEINNKISM